MSDLKKSYKKGLDLAVKFKKDLQSVLTGEHQGHILLQCTSAVDKMIGQLGYHAGEHVENGKSINVEDFPPITSFLGDPVEATDDAIEDKANVSTDQAKEYKKKILKLYTQWDTIAPEGLLNSYVGTPDEVDLRAVATLAEYPGAAAEKLDVKFIENVTKAMTVKKEKARQEAETEDLIQGDQEKLKK